MKRMITTMTIGLLLAGCSGEPAAPSTNDSEAENGAVETTAPIRASWPQSLSPFGDGYPSAGDPCRRVGESAATVDYLDDSADLVGCPSKEDAAALGGREVATVDGITLVSVRSKGAAPVSAAADVIRGKGGLEEKCKAEVARVTEARVIGTNRIEESQAAVEIYVNVEGAAAPWVCRGTRGGKVEGVEFTGSEGAL